MDVNISDKFYLKTERRQSTEKQARRKRYIYTIHTYDIYVCRSYIHTYTERERERKRENEVKRAQNNDV